MSKVEHPVMLIVLDGWGHSEETEFNAIRAAHTPVWDELLQRYPHELISCSGESVGLPNAQMGNSEVGHMHLGAGRTINQDFTRISRDVSEGRFADNATLKSVLERVANNHKACHILGLLSAGGVHSHEDHILALIEMAQACGVERVFIHAFLDGRDTPPRSAATSLAAVQKRCTELGVGRIASLLGRYYGMDRNSNWDRTQAAYELIVDGVAKHHCRDALSGLEAAYARGESDEFVQATTLGESADEIVKLETGDAIIFANFRSDRARQLTQAFTTPDFKEFPRCREVPLEAFATMTSYGEQFDLPVAYPPQSLDNTFGQWVADRGLRQLRIAETEKYAHVTFFFNGGAEQIATGEDRILIDSPDVATYDLKPEMGAVEVSDALVEALSNRRYDTIICNYANADMVGHTGNFAATVACIEALDRCLGRVISAARDSGTEILITADHGNAEKMRVASTDGEGEIHTAHTSNLVPLIYIGRAGTISSGGCLSDIAPTMLALMGLECPAEMTGRSLVSLTDAKQDAA